MLYWTPNLWKHWRHYQLTSGLLRYPLNIVYYYIIIRCSLVPQPTLEGLSLLRAVIGWPVFAFGLVITVVGGYQLIRATHFSVDPMRLDTSGVFSFLRNPQMAGAFHLQLGFATTQGAVYGFIMAFAFLAMYVIEEKLEARYLLEPRFGDEYRTYRGRVKGFIPFVF